MQRLLVFVLSISLALASAHRPSPNPNAKRSSEWEGQNYDRDVHEDSVRRSLSEVELGQPKVPPNAKRAPFNWGSHDDTSRNFRRNKPRAGPSITIPLVRRGHHRPFRSGLLSAKELEENAEVTDLNAIQAARDALIDKYTESEGAKRRLRDRRKRRDEMSALLEKEKAKAKRIIKDIAITNNNFDTVYSANLLLGTPAQSFSILLDTGSSCVLFLFYPLLRAEFVTLVFQRHVGHRSKLHLYLSRLLLVRIWVLLGPLYLIYLLETWCYPTNLLRLRSCQWLDRGRRCLARWIHG